MNTLAVAYFCGSQRLVLRRLLLAQKPKRTEERKDLKGIRDRFSGTPNLLCRDARFRFMIIIS